MEELQDYSGEFRPDLKLHDLSKDALVRLFQATAKLYVGLDGVWYSHLRELFGQERAMELDWENWRRATHLEVGRCREAMNIWGDDVASFCKFLQIDPGAGGVVWTDCDWDLKNKNHAVLTIRICRSLEYFERHQDTAALENGCGMEEWGLQGAANIFNPKIKVKALKLPPRKSKDEVACLWEFKMEE